ncbi:baculoviral IAP repeat-containing protein 6 isoform X2 [Labeo rohita]|uniref:baculoviral IAP repeat-containing protein 6 isoform X2 n=1 Tax=Labeo rohita TaxID=84645 RepID=UPI0021E2F90A|nr:baculoviral IAP repeat-containing protein 6 isoform X2 [Labeo rohita]
MAAAAAASPGSPDWVVLRDGCLRCDEEGLRSLSYHPALNAILAVTSRGSIKVIDGTSGAILQASALHAKPGGRVRCQYFPAVDKVLFVDDYAVGCRKDLNGILLLDTALQAPVSKPEDMVQLELPVTEAQQMLYACMEKVDVSNTEGYDLFLTQLKEGLENTSHETAANHKVAKWATVTFHLPHHVLKVVTSAIVNELKKLNQNVAALSVASSVMDRLSYLLPSGRPELGVGPGRSVDRSLMYSEANRRETFTSWPHTGYRWAQPDPMAQAGFYHQPASTGDDRAMCFTCSVCLVCWEPTDEPWSEHERHSPNCPFVKGEHTQNVPLSVTLATSPAQFPSADGSDKIVCYGFGSCPHFLATATKRGKICIWDVSKLMKVHLKFEVNPYDPAILRQLILSGSEQQSLTGTESRRPTLSWLEEATCCSDLPKLEGDSDDQIEDSDSEEHSRSESVTGPLGQKETMEVSLGVTALSVLQQPEKLQWEVVASVLEDTVKDLEELGANPPHSLGPPKAEKAKERPAEHHNIPFPCLLAGGLLSYRSAASSPLGPPPSRRSMDSPVRTAAPEGLVPDQGPMEIESCNPPTDLGSPNLPPAAPVHRTMPVLLLYSIKEADEKSSGKVFTQMNNLMSKGLHEEGFTVPQIIEMEFDSHEQLLLQDPPITYIQQFADAAAGLGPLDGEKWSSLAPRPGSLVQCLRLPKALEEENLYVDSITPCSDGLHLLVGLQPCSVESLSAINQVEVLNTLNRLHSALCGHRKGQTLANGHDAHSGTSPPQTPLILPPHDQQQPHTSRPLGGSGGGGYLALYKLNYSTRIVTLEEEPVKVQQIRDPRDAVTSLLLLPPDVLDGREDDGEETSEESTPSGLKNGTGTVASAVTAGPSMGTVVGKEKRGEVAGLGHLVVTTQAGYIMILDLSTLEVMAKVEPPKKEGTEEVDPFVSVTYCSGTDRLCACTKGGELHFLQIGGVCDDIDDADIFVDGPLSNRAEQLLDGAKPTSNPSSPGITGVDLLVDQPLTVETLSSLVELTRFETLTPRFSATVPPCWVEVQQEQQQRRHPQHLHQQHHGDAAQHTRTWKLQSDSSSWDEHVFELVLPKACMVGHVDFKFVLNSSITNIPQIQVTLLKNKAPGLGKVNETAVDRQIVFPLSHVLHSNGEKNGQPHLHDFSEDIQFMDIEESPGSRLCPFLQEHKDDILCGPVWLSSGLDLSGHAGMLSLTSPKLLKGMAGGKYRSFLVHIKAVNDKGLDESLRPVVRMPSAKPHSSKAHSLSSLLQRAQATKEKASTSKADPQSTPKKPDNLRGCDLLQEVSVTIRRFKKTSVPKERVQRCAMLQFPELHEKLLRGLCKRGEDGQSSEHCQSLILDILCWLAGVYSNGPCSLREGKEGLLTKTRRRLTDIIRACFFEAGRSIAHKCSRFLALCISTGKGDPGQQGFGQALFKALLDNMPYLPAAATGGSVFWYFVLLNYVKDEDLAGCSTACASLLTAVSRQLQDRLTPLEALLQTRYGLYGSPFDPVLFDLEVSGSSCKNAFSSSIGVQSDEIDLSDILSGNGKVNSSGAAEGSFTALTGLLEVEPLHFTCVSTSDGTRVERDDASMFTVSTFGVTPTVTGLSAGTVGEASTALSSAAQVALQSLSHAMVSAEQQLQVLQEKQQQLLKLQQQKAKLEAKLHQTTSAAATAASGVVNSVPSNPSSAPGFFIHPSDVIPPTPKTTPLFMTPPLTPPNEAVSAAISVELAQLFPGSVIDPPPVNLSAQNKNTQKAKPNPIGSGLALAISQASHFLQPPPHQSIIIERMHSGARRFVTLDFGRPVLLTDALIPTCADLASLSIDIWTLGEEVDGRRLVVATDISTHSLILHDLLPPPVCRFMKITVIGRYGSTNARAKIPLGFYYGHTYILPWESELKLMHDPLRGESEAASQPDLDQHLSMMVALQEDIQCRYNLACHRLETLLQNIDLPPLNSANNAQYFLRKPDKAVEEDSRVFSAYQDCIQLQLQLNLAHHAVQRLRVSLGATRKHLPETYDPRELVQNSSTEQLRTIIRYLLDTLLSLLHCCNGHSVPSVLQNTFHAQACEELFKQLCISGTPKIRLHAGLLLVQLCGGERWWGQFLSNVLQELYNSEQLLIFPQDRVFMLLSCIGQRSLSNSGVLEGLLNLLDTLLSPLQQASAAQTRRTEGVLDIPMISWVVMLVSRLLDYVASVEDEATAAKKPLGAKDRERSFTGNQWSFINNSLQSQNPSRSAKGNNSSLDRLYSRKIRKQLVHHKQLNLLKAKQKALVEQIEKEKIQSNKGSSYKLLVEQAKLKQATSKHFKDLIRLRRTAEWPRSTLDSEASVAKETPEVELLPFTLSHERCICVVQKLALFLLSMDFTCHADLLLFVCKVLARIANATRPTIHLCEVVSEQQLERLLLLLVGTDFNRGDISWGGAWAQYSLTCMLQDILAGELLSPVCADGMEGAGADEAGAAAASVVDSDDSLPQPTPIPLVETIDEPLGPDIIAGTPGTSSVFQSAPPLSSLEKDKDIDFDLLQDLMDVDIDPLDIDLEKDPLAAKVFKPISSTWYDYWGADYGSYSYNPYTGGVGIPVSKPPAAAATEKPGSQNLSVSVSQALDARLEVGLEQQAELMLKMMATLEADAILQALTSTSPSVAQSANGTDDSLLRGGFHSSPPSSSLMIQPSSIPMLSTCFNKLFSLLQVHHVQLESLLQLWLTLSLSSCSGGSEESGSDIFLFNASRVPTIPLNQASISSFLSVLAWYPNTSLRTWCLVLHSLTLMTNMPASASSSGMGVQESTAQQMVSDPTLVHVLVRFLSGGNPHGTSQHSSQVGPTATQALQEFLTRLQVHLSSTCPQMFSEFLLKLLHILSTERGPFQSGQGPLDAQVKLLEFTLEQNFEVVSVTTILAVIESITFLVHHYITCSDKVVSRSGSDSSVGARACFGGLFANIIRPGDAKAVCGETTRDQLMFDLLKLVNALVMLPLSGDREFSGRLPPAGGATDSVSDEEKVCGSKECGAAGTAQHQGPAAGVADLVLANQQIMSQILSALGQCNSSAMAMIIGASGLHLTKHENFHGGLDAISVGDGLFTILTTLSKRATSVQVMLQPILTYMACGYMGRQGSLSTCQLSEPLLWFILRVLDTSEALKAFHDMGGVQLICNNMVTSTRAIVNTARSMVSTIMKFLDSGPGKAADGSLKARVLTSEPDNAEGLHNFAPLGTITSSSPTAQPAEVLLQATPPHRRARSAAWSYIFLPEEAWCDLTIHLPAAVLLKEIHIQPHLASLATCPSSVSVEISADGVNMLPLSTPVITSGLTYIKFQLVKAEVASAVCLRLHRPRDASTLGLSQIKLLGLTAFGNTSSATVNNPFLPSEDQVSKTSIGWLRLLHHCLTHVSDLEAMMASAAAPTANLLQTCAALLMSPYCGMHSPNIEAVLVKIGLQSTRIGLKLIDILLRNCAASGTDLANLNSPLLFGRLNGLSSDSTIDILYQLGTTQDPGTKDRIQALLQWVYDSSRVAALKQSSPLSYAGASAPPSREYGLLMPSPSHLHCVASVLWHSYELPVDYDLPGLLNRELFELLYSWSMSLPSNMVLKKAVDSLLCSMCHIHPSYFSLLMSWMGIVAPPAAQTNAQRRMAMTDDGKKQHDLNSAASLTDDSKHARAPVTVPVSLSECQLVTLAAASQSPGAIQQLLDSGLPSLLVRSLADLCCNLLVSADLPLPAGFTTQAERRQYSYNQPSSSSTNRPPLSPELAAPVLRFLTEVGNSHTMKDWLGGPEVNPLWTALLFLLCHSSASGAANASASNGSNSSISGHGASPSTSHASAAPHTSGASYSLASTSRSSGLTTQQRTAIENATVAFFLQCISCHPNNQRLMAQVLCELFQSAPQRGNVPVSGNISGFIRRLFLQLMLEDEKVTVFLQSPCPLYKGRINATSHVIQHPMYGAGHKFRKLHLPISTTLSEVLDRVSDTPSITAKLINEQKEDKEKKNHEEKEKMKADNGFQDNYSVVVASGLKSQSKRALSTPPRPPSRRGRVLSDKLAASSGVDPSAKTISVPVFHLCHKLLPGQPLPPEMTLAQLLTLLYERKLPQGYRSIDLTVKLGSKVISDPGLSKTDSFKRLRTEKDHCEMLSGCPDDEPMTPGDEGLDAAVDDTLLETSPIQSPLQVFAGMGGLALIAERLPMLYPDVIQQVSAPVVPSTTQEKPKDSDQFEWVTIEQSGELVYEAPETIAAEPPPIKSSVQTMLPIPAHSLAAFGLFLRLPGYAEVLLKERKHAQCLLRLVLGVTDDGEGSHILQSPSANVLPTLPFHVLRSLFSSTPLTTDDGLLLRRMALEIGAIHLILACLSALSHHAPRVPSGSANSSEPQVSSGHVGGTTEEQQLYWAKGTGFGTGSTASGWDVEQALTKQRLEEEHVTCLLQVLASYINPSGCVGSGETLSGEVRGHSSSLLPSVLQELLSQSCLIPAMSSYLRNDSVLDMARHVPLYRALLELLRAISTCTSLVPLLLPLSGDAAEEEEDEERTECQTSVGMLLAKMKTCVDTYTNRLRSKKDKSKGVMKTETSDPEPEGLTLLVPDIQKTAEIVYAATTNLRQANHERKMAESSKKAAARPKPLSILRSMEEKYTAAMKKLQFDTFEMVCEDEDSKLVFKVNYHYLSQVKNASDANSAARARRLAQEAVTLSTSLPLSSSSSVFVRCDEERLDIMKVLITGPADTPYANGCFEFDVYFPQDYPNSPPLVNLETTGGHSVRFNPNLYNDGKVCLSILNTWHGRPEEKWNPQTSSFLQVLVSIQSLILVAEPYFNEPGYERSRGTPSGTQSSREYDGNIRQATVKWAMLEQIRNPSPCFKEVIHRHFYLKRAEIMAQCEGWICDIQQYSSDKRVGRTMSHHAAALKRHTAQLREELLKLPCPEGLEPDGEEFSEKSTSLMVKELPGQDAEKQTDSPDAHCSDGQL